MGAGELGVWVAARGKVTGGRYIWRGTEAIRLRRGRQRQVPRGRLSSDGLEQQIRPGTHVPERWADGFGGGMGGEVGRPWF